MATEILGFEELTSAEASKFVKVNANSRRLEAMTIAALSRTNGGPPIAPAEGDSYIVDVSSGDWFSFAIGSIAHFYLGTWKNYTPTEGQRLTILDENILGKYEAGVWTNLVASSGAIETWTIAPNGTLSSTLLFNQNLFINVNTTDTEVFLPTSPTLGTTATIADITLPVNQTNGSNNNILTINGNGENIEGVLQNVTSQIPGKVFKFIYSNSTYGWKLFK